MVLNTAPHLTLALKFENPLYNLRFIENYMHFERWALIFLNINKS